MIGKTALAFTAAIIIATAAVSFVGYGGYAMYAALVGVIPPGAAAACVAGVFAIFLLVALAFVNLRTSSHTHEAPPLHDVISSFTDTMKERPLLTLGLSAITGLAAARDATLLKELWAAVLNKQVSDQADADLTTTMVQLSAAQNAYQVAVQSGARLMSMPSLLDYLQ